MVGFVKYISKENILGHIWWKLANLTIIEYGWQVHEHILWKIPILCMFEMFTTETFKLII